MTVKIRANDGTRLPATAAALLSGMTKSVTIYPSVRSCKPKVNFGDPRASAEWQNRELRKHWNAVGGYLRRAMLAEQRDLPARLERDRA